MKKLSYNKIKNLNSFSGMPNMANTLTGWEVPLSLVRVTQDIQEGYLTTVETTIDFQGVWQPLKDERLELKPEGQRSWEWIWIHAKSGTLNLNTADKVKFNNKKYKVKNKKDYSLNGYVEYELVEDYEEIPEPVLNDEETTD